MRTHSRQRNVYEFLILILTNDSNPTFSFVRNDKRLKLRTWPRFVEIYLITGSRDKLKLIDSPCGWKKLRNHEAGRLGSCFYDGVRIFHDIINSSRRDVPMGMETSIGMKGSLIRIDSARLAALPDCVRATERVNGFIEIKV